MSTVTRSRSVVASPARVWQVLADFDGISVWAPDVEHSSYLTSQTSGVGASRRVQVGRMTLVETVTAWEEDQLLSYRIEGLPPVVDSVENTWELAADGDVTTISLTVDLVPGRRPPAKLAAKVIAHRFATANSVMLDGLVAAVESR